MTKENLVILADQICQNKAEEQTIELKAAEGGCPQRLYDTLSSFSNQDMGGIIVFGINEKKGFVPCNVYDVQDLQKKVTEQCNQMMPPVRAVFTTVEYKGCTICSAEIPGIDLTDRPCYYKGAGRLKGSFVRVGDADLLMTDYELYSFEAFRKHAHDDERVIEKATMQCFDMSKIDDYINKQKMDKPEFAKLPRELQEEMLNITRDGKPTIASLMNFCVYPQGYLPQMAITAIRVPGFEIGETDEQDTRFIDNKRIEGTLANMMDETLSFSMRNMKIATIIDKKTGKRIDRTEYPIKAIREAVLNALIHRDYSHFTEGTPVQLVFYANRLEIHSPGSLYGRMTVDQLGYSKPDIRNPALAVIAESQTEAENRYSGIPTIRLAMKEYGLPEPIFENRRSEFVVILKNRENIAKSETNILVQQNVEKNSVESLLSFCVTPRSRQEIANHLGLKTIYHVSKRFIGPLVEKKLLHMTIPDHPKSRNQKFYSENKLSDSSK